jgi:nucleotide-binding universal stress UspA family protein
MNWKRILVPHDFSASADHATSIAREEAKAHGAALVVLHVVDLPSQFQPELVVMPGTTGAPISVKDYAVRLAEEHLARITGQLAKDGLTATSVLRIGNPVDEIGQVATQENIDLIVMGTHGRTGLAHLLVGSVTERVVRTSKVPVLTVRHAE